MVKFELIEKNENFLKYEYYPEADKTKKPGIIIVDLKEEFIGSGASFKKSYQIKGIDNQYYNLKIYYQDKLNSILFKVIIVGDFTEIIYTNTLTLENFYNLNRFFRQYISIEEIYNLFFKNSNNKDLSLLKIKNIIHLNFFVLSLNKKEKINIDLIEEKISGDKMINKICKKIKEMERYYKLKESHNKTNKFFYYILLLSFILNIINIIIIYKSKNEINNMKIQLKDIKYIKNKDDFDEIKNIESYSNSNNNKNNYIDNYIHKYNAFDLINEGLRKKLNKKIKNYELIFQASKDGFKSKDFHNKCDYKSNTVSFILTKEKKIIGGFTDVSWDSESDAKEGSNGFIFSLDNKEIYYNINLKFNIRCIAEYGPIFGNFDIGISNDCNLNNKSYVSSYAYDTKDKNQFFENKNYFYVEDYATYQLYLENI